MSSLRPVTATAPSSPVAPSVNGDNYTSRDFIGIPPAPLNRPGDKRIGNIDGHGTIQPPYANLFRAEPIVHSDY